MGFIGLWWALALAMPVVAQTSARDILQRAAETFRRSGGVSASFAIHSPEGNSTGFIRLKGEKFVLEAGGMTTWFISEPTDEELQTLNPYAWLSLYDRGYDVKLLPAESAGQYKIEMVARSTEAQVSRVVLWLERSALQPVKFALTLSGSVEPTVITVRDYRTEQTYPDALFVFDPREYPTAEVIDLR